MMTGNLEIIREMHRLAEERDPFPQMKVHLCTHSMWDNCVCREINDALVSLNRIRLAIHVISEQLSHDLGCPKSEIGCCGCKSTEALESLSDSYKNHYSKLVSLRNRVEESQMI